MDWKPEVIVHMMMSGQVSTSCLRCTSWSRRLDLAWFCCASALYRESYYWTIRESITVIEWLFVSMQQLSSVSDSGYYYHSIFLSWHWLNSFHILPS